MLGRELESLSPWTMKRRLTALLVALLLVASFASAQETVYRVLRADGTVYSIDASKATGQLEVKRRRGEIRDTLLVPSTDDEAVESDARLVLDSATGSVFVVWHSSAEDLDEIRLAVLDSNDEWSKVHLVASSDRVRRAGLQVILTHARVEGDESDTTLLHAAWWSIGTEMTPEYALVAFESNLHLSTEVDNLRTFTKDVTVASLAIVEDEDTGEVAHPPLAMNAAGKFIDILHGDVRTTTVTRVRVEPTRVSSEARIWRPSGKALQHTPPARLTSLGATPVQAFLNGDRFVLYTPDVKFRYSVYDDGVWTPIRTIELDENLTSQHVLEQLRRSVEEAMKLDTPGR
jgi:hypothetical protein